MVRPLIHGRANTPAFANNVYYTFHNPVDENNTLSSGQSQNTKGAISMTIFGGRSSENWQLYYQQGRYFIRNYDYGGSWQLGLTEDSLVVPKLMARSGALGQQWTMTRQDDGSFKFTNGLLGNDSALALAKGNTQPGMQSAQIGTTWNILSNPSALAPKDPLMMQDVADFVVEQVTSSSIAPSATTPPATSGTGTTKAGSIASSTSAPTQSLTSPITNAKSSSLAPGAIAGIAVGVVLLLALASLLGYFLWSRRKPKAIEKNPVEIGPSEQKSYYAHHAPIGQDPTGQLQQQHAYPQYGAPAQPETHLNRFEMGDSAPVQNQQIPGQDVKAPYTAMNNTPHRSEM